MLTSIANFVSTDVYTVAEREELFLTKLRACTVIYDFTNELDIGGKELKRNYLQDILDYVTQCKSVFTERTLHAFMAMVSANILRALPVGSSTDETYDLEEDEPSYEPAWSHLQLVYELLRKFIVSSDSESSVARSLITPRFVSGIVDLFNSEDPREREYLKTILHRIYGKVMPLRTPIRRCIAHTFHRVVHEPLRHNGISELLEILGSIINGFSIPLKEEHKFLLRRALLPLHTAPTMPQFHNQLSYCVTEFVNKDPTLAPEVMKEMIRHWPITHTRKEVMFLNELEELIDLIDMKDSRRICIPLFKQLARSTQSLHFQVAERGLYYWHNQKVVNLFEQNRDNLMPIFAGVVHENIKSHWNSTVKNLSYHVQSLLQELDISLYEKCMKQYRSNKKLADSANCMRARRWRELDELAQRRRNARASASLPDLALVAAAAAAEISITGNKSSPHAHAASVTDAGVKTHASMDDLSNLCASSLSPSHSSSTQDSLDEYDSGNGDKCDDLFEEAQQTESKSPVSPNDRSMRTVHIGAAATRPSRTVVRSTVSVNLV